MGSRVKIKKNETLGLDQQTNVGPVGRLNYKKCTYKALDRSIHGNILTIL